MRFLFRADASVHLGSGHVMRCLTLATKLKALGHDCVFACQELTGNMLDFIRSRGFEALGTAPTGLPTHFESSDLDNTVAALPKGARFDWCIVDHYRLAAHWETGIRTHCGRVMVIDDLADRHHDADLLLDQNEYPNFQSRYKEQVPEHCRLLLGARYALLREEFAATRAHLPPRPGTVDQLLVFFGGADEQNATGTALEALIHACPADLSITVVTGGQNPHRDDIAAVCARNERTHHLTQVSNMAELMASSDLAIGASGSTNWERCCLGLPALVWSLADNQSELLQALAERGAVLAPTGGIEHLSNTLPAAVQALRSNPALMRNISRIGMAMCDGQGVSRVVSRLCGSALQLREANMQDADLIYQWRNHPVVRKASHTTETLDPEQHLVWFTASLQNPDRCLFVGLQDGIEVGVIRFDRNDQSAVVSLFISPERLGWGLGEALLAEGEQAVRLRWPTIDCIEASVMAHNEASQRLFQRAGYRLVSHQFKKGLSST